MQQGILYFVFFLSGVAGLGYEILWTRMLSVSLGHEIISVLAVVSAYFSGLALGAWVLDSRVSLSKKPHLWYSILEIIIGVWALALTWLIPELNKSAASWIGAEPSVVRHWVISFLYPFAALLPATMAMGGTLPAIDRLLALNSGEQRSVGGLYSINTFGAMAGILATTFFILPLCGTQTTSIILGIVNFLCAALVFVPPVKKISLPDKKTFKLFSNKPGKLRIYWILLLTGLLGIGFEIMMVRVLSQLFENTIFSFASILMMFLLGTAIGAAVYQKTVKTNDFEKPLFFLIIGTSTTCLISFFILRYIETIFLFLQGISHIGIWSAVLAEMMTSGILLILPTIFMGATFSHIAQSIRKTDGGVGRALCLNTIGGAVAPLLIGVYALPALGIKWAMLLAGVGYLLAIPRFRISYALFSAIPVLIAIGIALNPFSYQFVDLSSDENLVDYRQGVTASVSVVQDDREALHLKVNNHFQMGGTTSIFSDRRQAHLPLLLHPQPEEALFLGLGTGATFATAASYPDLKAEAIELVPEIIEMLPHFKKINNDLEKSKNLKIISSDARRYVVATQKKYDVVIADLFHPARDGAGSLFTAEHFKAVKSILNEDGIFCQWLPLYQMDLDMFKIITRTFIEEFPHAQAFLGHFSLESPMIALIGTHNKPLKFPEKWYRKRVNTKGLRREASGFGYDSIYSLLGTFLADSDQLKTFCSHSRVNTDSHPVVVFKAPVFVYGNPGSSGERLLSLLNSFSTTDPESILAEVITEEDYLARERLTAYISARNRFLEIGMKTQKTGDVMKLYKTISEPLLSVVRKSSDFSAAYYPLLSIAYNLYPVDREASRSLLMKLEKASPMRHEAGYVRRNIFKD